MKKIIKTALILERLNVPTMLLGSSRETAFLMILNKKLWEAKLCLRLSEVTFDSEEEDDEVYDMDDPVEDENDAEQLEPPNVGVRGITLEIITCNRNCYYEFALFDVLDTIAPIHLARMVLDEVQYLNALDSKDLLDGVRRVAVRKAEAKRHKGQPEINIDFIADSEGFRYRITREPGEFGLFAYYKPLLDKLIETMGTYHTPLDLGL
jgi:hypothetical protein